VGISIACATLGYEGKRSGKLELVLRYNRDVHMNQEAIEAYP
jgi:hypothetical protein